MSSSGRVTWLAGRGMGTIAAPALAIHRGMELVRGVVKQKIKRSEILMVSLTPVKGSALLRNQKSLC
jgi:hypothetical protein